MAPAPDAPCLLVHDIPFTDLKAGDLEACVYWRLEALEAKDLAWRPGGAGSRLERPAGM